MASFDQDVSKYGKNFISNAFVLECIYPQSEDNDWIDFYTQNIELQSIGINNTFLKCRASVENKGLEDTTLARIVGDTYSPYADLMIKFIGDSANISDIIGNYNNGQDMTHVFTEVGGEKLEILQNSFGNKLQETVSIFQ